MTEQEKILLDEIYAFKVVFIDDDRSRYSVQYPEISDYLKNFQDIRNCLIRQKDLLQKMSFWKSIVKKCGKCDSKWARKVEMYCNDRIENLKYYFPQIF